MAKKMLLVDPRMMQSLSSNNKDPPVSDPLSDMLRRLDGDMERIMRNSSLALSEKLARYNEILSDYLNKTQDYRERERAPLNELSVLRESMNPIGGDDVEGEAVGDGGADVASGVGEDEMISLVSDRFRPKARRLFAFLRRQPNVSWNDRGEVKIDGRVHKGSHIVDLVSRSVKPTRARGTEPEGWRSFVDVLRRGNVPLDLMSGSAQGAVVKRKREESSDSIESDEDNPFATLRKRWTEL